MLAYHNDASIKSVILAELARHRKADELVQGYGYWLDGKGCAVGCTIKSGDHIEYETRFGIPVTLARLEDCIFEGLPVELARQWPERFMSSIEPGKDLSLVSWQFLHWLLTEKSVNPGIDHPLVTDAVKQCADVIADLAAGKQVDERAASAASAASAAWSAAWSAVSAAESAAWSAASAARSAASAARSAARSAASAAESAAESAAASAARSAAESAAWSAASAASAARSAAYVAMADKLIDLISKT